MKHLLIVFHSKTGHTEKLVEAVYRGATSQEISGIEVRIKQASQATDQDLLWADGAILGTPENFGYMSGALKDFFDRTFYEVEGRLSPLPYALVIGAGNDGTGAVRSIERIANGYPLTKVAEPIISRQVPTDAILKQCEELGGLLAAGLEMGIF
ncbi:MAG: NAD(P)H-dependent oxidoreductase [Pseudomonadota bacterium]